MYDNVVLKGHEGPITKIKFGKNNVLFSCSKDKKIICWDMVNKKSIWELNDLSFHRGAILDIDINKNLLVSGSSDCSSCIWDLTNQKLLKKIECDSIVCCVSLCDDKLAIVQDKKFGAQPKIIVYSFDEITNNFDKLVELAVKSKVKIVKCLFANDETIYSGSEDGSVYCWNIKDKKIVKEYKFDEPIKDLLYMNDKNMLIVCLKKKVIFIDDKQDEQKELVLDNEINSCSFSDDYLIFGGGVDPMRVALEERKENQFDVFIYDNDLKKIGSTSGHFGPINCTSFSLDGCIYCSGSEDGTIRVNEKKENKLFPLIETKKKIVQTNQKYVAPKALSTFDKNTTFSSSKKNTDPNTLYVSNLSYDMTEDDLYYLFECAGDIRRIKKPEGRNIAFITYYRQCDADYARGKFNNYGYQHMILHVN